MDLLKILKVIRKYKSFLITTHVSPDPDALASQLAIALYLKSLGKRVHLINADHLPKRFTFFPSSKLIKKIKNNQKVTFDAAIIVDCGDLDRIGLVKNLIRPGHILINIDHHITNKGFGDLNMLVTGASSTAEVIFDLLRRARFSLTKNIAVLLYLGIMTDTGSFRYENTTAHTHEVVADLMRFRFSVPGLYRKIYECVPLNDIRYFTKVANVFDTLHKGRVICVELRRHVVKKFSEEFDLRDKIFRFLRAVKNVEVVIILTEQKKKNETRVNFRAQGKVDVAALAARFQGGGHRQASGCLVKDNIKEARKRILSEIRKVL